MLHVYLIAIASCLVLRDQFAAAPGAAWLGPSLTALLIALVCAGAWLLVWIHAVVARREIDQSGSLRPLYRVGRTASVAVLVSAVSTCVAIALLGWLDAVRGVVGNVILLDELLAILPFVLVVIGNWWAMEPLERRMREATLLRQLDEGSPVYAVPSRAMSVWMHVRHGLLIVLVPLVLIWGWSEIVRDVLMPRLEGLAVSAQARWEFGLQSAGLAAVIVLAPALIRRVWDTLPMPTETGDVGARLLALARACGVKVSRVLLWRTGGTLANGAVLGVVPRWRYVLLTDALLDHLSDAQLDAVMAHELGHVKHKHLPWLIACLMVSSVVLGVLLKLGLWLTGASFDGAAVEWIEIGSLAVSLPVALVVFGWVSRRFEWQADAFAARAMSRVLDTERSVTSGPITLAGISAMAGALAEVSRLNGMDPRRFTFRHGSINDRIRRLQMLEGCSGVLPVDNAALAIKCVAIAGVLLIGVGVLVGAVSVV